VGALLALHLALSFAPALSAFRNDFLNYYLPARALRQGRSLDLAYDRLWMAVEAERAGVPFVGLFMPNPPPNALLLVPLAGLPPAPAKAFWTVLLAVALLAAFLVLRRWLPLPAWLLALAFLVPSSSTANALAYGPPYALLLLLSALALGAFLRRRDWACGLLLAPVVALKLYALALLPYFLWKRRWRAAAALVAGSAVLAAVSVSLLGLPVHLAYLREMLPASLQGRVIDPYSSFWQTLPAVSRRLFQPEADLNPAAAANAPMLGAFLSRFAGVAVLAASVLATRAEADETRARREWAAVLLGSLAASPMTASYHLVLLVLPCAILLAGAGPRLALAVLALLAFAGSPLPHLFTPLATGWANLLACPRLLALLALWLIAVGPLLSRGAIALSAAAALLAGATALFATDGPPPGARLQAARGLLLAEPVACEGRVHWAAPERHGYVVLGDDGSRRPGDTLRCVDGRLQAGRGAVAAAVGTGPGADVVDYDRAGEVAVMADVRMGELREQVAGGGWRVLARGVLRRPRISPDGRWVLVQAWQSGSWDVRAIDRQGGRAVPVAGGSGNETEPSWSEDGARVLFVSDWRRGLFGGALYSVPFPP
jgi:hypothetical protein